MASETQPDHCWCWWRQHSFVLRCCQEPQWGETLSWQTQKNQTGNSKSGWFIFLQKYEFFSPCQSMKWCLRCVSSHLTRFQCFVRTNLDPPEERWRRPERIHYCPNNLIFRSEIKVGNFSMPYQQPVTPPIRVQLFLFLFLSRFRWSSGDIRQYLVVIHRSKFRHCKPDWGWRQPKRSHS